MQPSDAATLRRLGDDGTVPTGEHRRPCARCLCWRMNSAPPKRHLWLAACGTAIILCFAACRGSYGQPYQKPPYKPPYKPGDSIRKTKMCTCKACDPKSCCRELEQERPELQDCAKGYDFSQCELEVSSCESNCYQHRWRIQAGQTCVSKRPDVCCHQND